MQLYFIRHGQSSNNAGWERHGPGYPRVEDPELTDIGRVQAEHLVRFLSRGQASQPVSRIDFKDVDGFDFTHLYTSLMVRCAATGTAIAKALDLPLVAWKDLHEVGGIFLTNPETGEDEGLPGYSRAYFEKHYPHLVLPDDLGHDGWWGRPVEGREERLPRAQRFHRELIQRHGGTDDRVAVVSHGGFFNYLMCTILGVSRDQFWFVMNNVAIARIDFGERVRIVYANRTGFLPAELIT